jgi:hypothetical protein
MSGEQFLNSIRHLDNEINALEYERVRIMDRRQELLDAAYPSSELTGVCVQTMPGSKTESIGIQLAGLMTAEDVANKINQYQARINRKIDKLVDMKDIALDYIDRIEDDRSRVLLILRYINCRKWVEVSEIMGYTDAYIRIDIKDAAISEFERVWAKQPSFSITRFSK